MNATAPDAGPAGTPVTEGIHHLGLSVPDVARTAEFFVRELNFREVGGNPGYPAIFVSDGTVMLTLWQIAADNVIPFDRQGNIGLHHVAIKVRGQTQLADLHRRLSSLPDVEIEFAPEPLGGTPATHMMCRIPGGLRVEFIHAA